MLNVWKKCGLALVLVLLAGLLVACGSSEATNNNFDVPALTGLEDVPSASTNSELQNKLLNPKSTTITQQELKVYSVANRALADLQKSYQEEMLRRGWIEVSPNVVGREELGNQGLVMAFEKYQDGDQTRKHVAGLIMLSPDLKNALADTIRQTGQVQTGRTVVVVVKGASGIATPTPKP